jgi:DNA-binding transcriptional MerR regulator
MPIIENNEIYLSVKEAYGQLGISRQALDGYVKRGLLKKYPRDLGKRVFFKQSEIDNLKRIKQPEEQTETSDPTA